ncbi:hypothetical protein RQP46_010330 [Phenoliferia psychrophenolica]
MEEESSQTPRPSSPQSSSSSGGAPSSWVTEKRALESHAATLASSLASATQESQVLARSLARRRAAAHDAHESALVDAQPSPLRLASVESWDAALEELGADKDTDPDRLVQLLEDAFYKTPKSTHDPRMLGTIYYLASQIQHPRLAALREAILVPEKVNYVEAIDRALGVKLNQSEESESHPDVEAETDKRKAGEGLLLLSTMAHADAATTQSIPIDATASSSEPVTVTATTDSTQALSIARLELQHWKKIAQELQTQSQSTKSPDPSDSRSSSSTTTAPLFSSDHPPPDPSTITAAEERIAALERELHFRGIDADALSLKNKTLKDELVALRGAGGKRPEDYEREIEELRNELQETDREVEQTEREKAQEIARWQGQLNGRMMEIEDLRKKLQTALEKREPDRLVLVEDDETEAGRLAIEWIDMCIAQRDDEGFKKRVSELEAARTILIKETEIPPDFHWRRGVNDNRTLRSIVERLERDKVALGAQINDRRPANDYSAESAKSSTEIDRLNRKNRELERTSSRLTQTNTRQLQTISILNTKIADLERKISLNVSSASSLTDYDTYLDHILSFLDTLMSQRESEGDRKRVAELETCRRTLTKDSTKPSWSSFKSILSIRKEVERLAETNAILQAASEQDHTASDELDKLRQESKAKISELEQMIQTDKAEISRLVADLAAAKALQVEVDERTAWKLTAEQLQRRVETLEAQLEKSIPQHQQLVAAQAELNEAKSRIAQLEETRKDNKAEIRFLNASLGENEELQSRIESLEAQLEEATASEQDRAASSGEPSELQQELSEAKARIAELEEARKDNTAEIRFLNAALADGDESSRQDATQAANERVDALEKAVVSLRENVAKHAESKLRWKKKLEESEQRVRSMLEDEVRAKASWDVMGNKLSFLHARHAYVVSHSDALLKRASEEVEAKDAEVAASALAISQQAERIEELENALLTARSSDSTQPAPAVPKMDTLKTILERNDLRRQVAALKSRCEEAERAKDRQTNLAVEGIATMRNRLEDLEKAAGIIKRDRGEDDKSPPEEPTNEPATPDNPFVLPRSQETTISTDADITYLAPETLGRIFELGAEDEAAKVPFLLATSLVCRAWRHESQARLWHTIIFKSKNALDDSPTNTRVVDSPALGRFVTVSATFEGPREIGPKLLSGEQIPRILMSLRGLQSLVITGTKNIPATAFLGANLSALSSLTLIKAEIVDFHNVTPVPFRLKSLYLAANIDDAPYFLESVLITSGLKGITAFVPNWSDDLQVLMRVLPTHSADIEHVELGYGEWSPEVYEVPKHDLSSNRCREGMPTEDF